MNSLTKTRIESIDIFRGIVMVILVLVFSSCTSTMYVPNMINVPMFEKKGQLNTTLTLRDLQVAYAATNNIGFTLNGHYRPINFLPFMYEADQMENKNQGLDMAFTYYKALEKTSNEMLIGYGQGSTSFSYDRYGGGPGVNIYGGSSNFRKYYLQYDFIWLTRKKTKWTFTTKLDVVTLIDFKDTQENPLPNCASLIFAPGLSMKKTFEEFTMLVQVQCPLPSAVEENKLSYSYWGEYPPFHSMVMLKIGLGIDYNLGNKKKE